MNLLRMKKSGLFYYASPEKDADLRHATAFLAPDRFLCLFFQDSRVAVLSSLEIDRARATGTFDEIWDLAEIRKSCGPHLADQIIWLANRYELGEIAFPEDFPAHCYDEVRQKSDLPIKFITRPVRMERLLKTFSEQRAIAKVNAVVSRAFSQVEKLLGESKVRDGLLYRDGEALTSESIRREIALLCLKENCFAEGTIVAGGEQACDPHERGHGPLSSNQLLIVDIFPRDLSSGYYGDMTRTYLKGEASPDQTRLVETVLEAQKRALEGIREGVTGNQIHQAVVDCFNQSNYHTGRDEKGYHGFFHGTGHGLGLEIHEQPRVSKEGGELKAGMVVTIEPGLYYRGLGACRMEDVICVTPTGYEFLSHHSYDWKLP